MTQAGSCPWSSGQNLQRPRLLRPVSGASALDPSSAKTVNLALKNQQSLIHLGGVSFACYSDDNTKPARKFPLSLGHSLAVRLQPWPLAANWGFTATALTGHMGAAPLWESLQCLRRPLEAPPENISAGPGWAQSARGQEAKCLDPFMSP